MAGGTLTHGRKSTAPVDIGSRSEWPSHASRTRRPDPIGPVAVSCPHCDTDLGPRVRATLESVWSAARRPVPREVYLVCPSCRTAWVASLWLSIAAFAGSEVAA